MIEITFQPVVELEINKIGITKLIKIKIYKLNTIFLILLFLIKYSKYLIILFKY